MDNTKKQLDKRLNRREFIRSSAGGLAAMTTGGLISGCSHGGSSASGSGVEQMPHRMLGKTGESVSLLSFGGGSQFMKNPDGQWEPLLERAIKLGVNYFDTSSDYIYPKAGNSEERFGQILPSHRKKILISTKFNTRKKEEMREEIEGSLKRMKIDYVDVLFIHSVEASDSPHDFEKGIYAELVKFKQEGLTRFIGFSSMNSAEKSKELLERLDFDVTMLAMNPTKYGDFAKVALPLAKQKNVGVIAMKVMRDLVGKGSTAEELVDYVLGQEGVESAIIGHFGMEVLEENVRLVKAWKKDQPEKLAVRHQELERRLAPLAGAHALCWARPEYRDGGNWMC